MNEATLLIEIGCEELPYRFCESALAQLEGRGGAGLVAELLGAERLLPEQPLDEQLRVLAAPRRIAVLVKGVPVKQRAEVKQFRGPRADVAYDAEGVPTKAGAGFARGKGVPPEALRRQVIDGTEFVVAEVEAERRPAAAVLPALIGRLVTGLQVPRGMRWGRRPAGADDFLRFSRPIRWIVCKHGDETIAADFYGLRAGDVTQGHRVLGSPLILDTADHYERHLEEQMVVADQAERLRRIKTGLDERAAELQGAWSDPGEVLAEAIYLAEWPSVARGGFDKRHLRLPDEVLITAMQSHQRYFPVRAGGGLLPAFLYVSNGDPAAAELVTHGNERVLEGRLDDAEFAYDRDLAEGLPAMAGRLGAVVFHEKLGSLADKAQRLGGLVAGLADCATLDARLCEDLRRAAALAKADLVSQTVIEFPSLQGTMGGIFARAAGESDGVAHAVAEHYLPLSATAALPGTLAGALLAVAEKTDNIAGAWAAGQKPSGSRDPYGLRRAAIGIVRISLQFSLRLPLRALFEWALDQYEIQTSLDDAVRARLGDPAARSALIDEMQAFVLERLQALLLDEGVAFPSVEAALAAPAGDVPAWAARARTFAALAGRRFFEDAVVAYNRCFSLASKAGAAAGAVDPALFTDEAERVMAAALDDVRPPVEDALKNLELESALVAAARLRPAVDRYFEDVLVMDKEARVRANRLAQLAAVVALLGRIGEFSRLPLPDDQT